MQSMELDQNGKKILRTCFFLDSLGTGKSCHLRGLCLKQTNKLMSASRVCKQDLHMRRQESIFFQPDASFTATLSKGFNQGKEKLHLADGFFFFKC